MPKGIPPKQKECRCWQSYPNSNLKERCSYYYCIKPMCLEFGKRRTKTVCRLKESDNNGT